MKLPTLRIGTTVDHLAGNLAARQYADTDPFSSYDDAYVPFWYTKTGIIVKWSLFLGILAIFTAYLLIGYLHAKKRVERGLPPLAYHRWLVSRAQLARVDPRYAYPQPAGFSTYRPQQPNEHYGMYAMPPPVYDPTNRPPVYGAPYSQPQDASGAKVDPDQSGRFQATVSEELEVPPPAGPPPVRQQAAGGEDGEYEPPAGPPPSTVKPQGTGGSNPFRN